MQPVRAVFFDVGETLVDEGRAYGVWADWLGVPRHTFWAVFGAVIAGGADHREVFSRLRPGIDLAAERAALHAAGHDDGFAAGDLYPDARPCLAELRSRGLFVGVVGNQPRRAEQTLRDLDLAADFIATSSGWGVAKPDPGFFERVAAESGFPAAEIAYVGDRVDNDVVPAVGAGMVAVLVRRGPWGHVLAGHPGAARAHLRVDSLAELPAALGELSR